MKASEIRKKRGQYATRARTKLTTGNVGPRDTGPHGLTLNQRPHYVPPMTQSWTARLFDTFRRVAEGRQG